MQMRSLSSFCFRLFMNLFSFLWLLLMFIYLPHPPSTPTPIHAVVLVASMLVSPLMGPILAPSPTSNSEIWASSLNSLVSPFAFSSGFALDSYLGELWGSILWFRWWRWCKKVDVDGSLPPFCNTSIHSYTHSSIHSFIHPFVHSYVHSYFVASQCVRDRECVRALADGWDKVVVVVVVVVAPRSIMIYPSSGESTGETLKFITIMCLGEVDEEEEQGEGRGE